MLAEAVGRFEEVTPETERKLFGKLLTRYAQLWIAWDMKTDALIGVVTTELCEHRGHQCMEIPLVAGKDLTRWMLPLWRILTLWGEAQGATHAVGYGRKGWKRVLGFEEVGQTERGVLIMARPLKGH